MFLTSCSQTIHYWDLFLSEPGVQRTPSVDTGSVERYLLGMSGSSVSTGGSDRWAGPVSVCMEQDQLLQSELFSNQVLTGPTSAHKVHSVTVGLSENDVNLLPLAAQTQLRIRFRSPCP